METSPAGAAPAETSRRADLAALAIGLAPVVGEWVWKVLVHPRPYWVWWDPEAWYYGSSLDLLAGRTPTHVDHPDTPVQILGALVAFVTGRDPAAIDGFLVGCYALTIVLVAAGAWLFLRTVLRGAPAWAKVAALWAFFAAP